MSTSKEMLIEACVKGGKTKEECLQIIADAFPAPKTDGDLIRDNEMLKARLKTKEDQVKQAIDIANKAEELQKARDDAERQDIIDRIVVDSNRKFTPIQLQNKTLSELRLINTVLQTSMDQTFASVAALQAERDTHKKPLLTAGAWDSKTQSWVGGL